MDDSVCDDCEGKVKDGCNACNPGKWTVQDPYRLIRRLTYALQNRGGLDVFPDLMNDAFFYLENN